MAITTFSGLASGIDTASIIKAIMDVEREPLNRLEREKEYLSSRLQAFSEFESKLDALSSALADMNSADKLGSYSLNAGSDEYFSLAVENPLQVSQGGYQLEVVNLAHVQKDVSGGFSETDSAVFSAGTITINGIDIAIAGGSSLNDIRSAINEANDSQDTGVRASLIHDGINYRMVLTGRDADSGFTVSASGISDGSTTLGFSTTQAAEPAEIVLDGITITSGSNSISNAIPGVSIDLLKENAAGESTTVAADRDFEAITTKLQAFVKAYNGINSFIEDQQDADWANDYGFRSVSSKLRNLLVTDAGGTGAYNYLVDIGFKTDSKTGAVSIDTAKLNEALNGDYESVEALLVGNESIAGVFEQFTSYLDDWTDSANGIYAGKKQNYDSSVRTIDTSIERMELRLEKREALLLAQFSAMEELVNSLNSTSAYLSQQLANLPSIGGTEK